MRQSFKPYDGERAHQISLGIWPHEAYYCVFVQDKNRERPLALMKYTPGLPKRVIGRFSRNYLPHTEVLIEVFSISDRRDDKNLTTDEWTRLLKLVN